MRTIMLTIIIATTFQIGNTQNYIGKQKEIDKILENIEKFSGYVMTSNYEMIGNSYTKNGKIFPNNREIIEGREKIIEYWRLPEGVETIYHKIIPKEIKIKGKEAYDYGHYEGKTKRANGEEVSWKGKYVIVWKKEGKNWKMYLDIWNRISD